MGIQLVHGHRNYADYIVMLYDLCTYFVYIKYIYAIDKAFELPDLTLCYAEDKTRTLKWLWSMAWESEARTLYSKSWKKSFWLSAN